MEIPVQRVFLAFTFITVNVITLAQQPPIFQAQCVQHVRVIVMYAVLQVFAQHAAQDIISIMEFATILAQQQRISQDRIVQTVQVIAMPAPIQAHAQ